MGCVFCGLRISIGLCIIYQLAGSLNVAVICSQRASSGLGMGARRLAWPWASGLGQQSYHPGPHFCSPLLSAFATSKGSDIFTSYSGSRYDRRSTEKFCEALVLLRQLPSVLSRCSKREILFAMAHPCMDATGDTTILILVLLRHPDVLVLVPVACRVHTWGHDRIWCRREGYGFSPACVIVFPVLY